MAIASARARSCRIRVCRWYSTGAGVPATSRWKDASRSSYPASKARLRGMRAQGREQRGARGAHLVEAVLQEQLQGRAGPVAGEPLSADRRGPPD
ncbi:hypothetical protein ACGFX8_02745 [Streptomyces sp. NPDC048362]|uniref:hypothetical protein n=1 Tax=Streptomyces sp. NPDC048362 TaxID=3365539 RepID=UPI00371B0AC2